jgi:hypothetical protein
MTSVERNKISFTLCVFANKKGKVIENREDHKKVEKNKVEN